MDARLTDGDRPATSPDAAGLHIRDRTRGIETRLRHSVDARLAAVSDLTEKVAAQHTQPFVDLTSAENSKKPPKFKFVTGGPVASNIWLAD